jgi:hypothetical protein
VASYTPAAAYSELPPAAAAVPSLTDKKQSKKITMKLHHLSIYSKKLHILVFI